MPAKKFRYKGDRLMLTFSHHIDKVNLRELLEDAAGQKFETFEAAHETGEKKDYPHTHAVIVFSTTLETTNARFFDVTVDEEIIHPHWQKFPAKDLGKMLAYLSKEDLECAHLKDRNCLAKGIWAKKTLQEAFECSQKASDFAGIKLCFDNKALPKLEVNLPDRPWQKEFLKMIKEKQNCRLVDWFCDKTGGAGKSYLARFLTVKYPEEFLCIRGGGKAADMFHIIVKAIKNGWQGSCIIDCSRSSDFKELYHVIECLQDGSICSTKYDSTVIHCRETKVYVFANDVPMLGNLSADRWSIHQLA